MNHSLPTKILIVAVVKKGDTVLLRKKPDGSPPYKETWYMFGAELIAGEPIAQTLTTYVQAQTGVVIRDITPILWDSEVKVDLDGTTKQFIYLDVTCEYADGELEITPGIEKLEWVPVTELATYDNVPPSVELFKRLGYIKS